MGDVAAVAQRIRDALFSRDLTARVVRSNGDATRYQELTGAAAPPEVAELWSTLGGVDVAGMYLEGAESAGQACDARASEAEAYGPGVPYEELDGSTDLAVRNVWWDRGWCPLVLTADNAVAVDNHPGNAGKVGQVIYCDFEVYSDREAIWDSVVEFLHDVLTVLSSKELVIENGFGSLPTDDGWSRTVMMSAVEIGIARRDGRPAKVPTA